MMEPATQSQWYACSVPAAGFAEKTMPRAARKWQKRADQGPLHANESQDRQKHGENRHARKSPYRSRPFALA